jgi:hypothetical protein
MDLVEENLANQGVCSVGSTWYVDDATLKK